MRNFTLLALSAIVVLAIVACKPQAERLNEAGEPATAAKPEAAVTTIARLSKTPCYGTCPVFTIEVLSNNRLRYTGKENVEMLGTFKGIVEGEPVKEVARLVKAANFFELPSSFPEDRRRAPTDIPATITKISMNDQEHQILNLIDAPDKLTALEDYLLSLVKKASWTPVNADD